MEKLHNIFEFIKSRFVKKKADPYGDEDEFEQDEDINQPLVYEVEDEPDVASDNMEEVFSEEANEPKNILPLAKIIKALGLLIVFIAMIITGYMLNPFGEDKAENPLPVQKIDKQEDEKEQPKMADSASVPINEVALALKKNPFIEAAAIQTATESGNNNNTTQAQENSSGNRVSYTASSLPAIPNNYPRPRIPMPGQFNVPAAGSQPVESATPSSNNVTVQGVLTGEDGHNMAIMSDGSVISEGETFQDGRIAYIGGDGITFENGNKLKY